MVHGFGKNLELKINVMSDQIVLLGHAEEAAGKLLQGTLELNVNEPIKVKSVMLSFIGKMKVSWSEGVGHHQNYHKQERIIKNHVWKFVNPQNQKKAVLNAGKHTWNFELLLPGDLPQTLESDVGCVSYQLKATIERTAFVQDTTKKKTIRILRCLVPSQYDLVQSLEIHNIWAEKMVYNISVPSKLYAFNDIIPISFNILPIASQLRVNAIMASIKEYCTYSAHGHSKTDTRIVRFVRTEYPFSEAVTTSTTESWNRVVDLPLPSKSPMIFADAESDMIRVRHRLKFVITLINADGHISELRCAVPIIIVESFAVTEELTTLPAYDEMWRSVPYEPHIVEQLRTRTSISEQGTQPIIPTQPPMESRQPVSISGWSRVLSVSTPINIPNSTASSRNHSRNSSISSPQPLWWNGIELDKVPSYQSVSNVQIATSLPPAYDTLNNNNNNNNNILDRH